MPAKLKRRRAVREQVVTREMPRLTMRAEVAPQTFNKEKRTVEVTWTTGARVKRGGFFTMPYHEELSLDPKHVRMDRLNGGGAPLLLVHKQDSIESIVGVVESARLEKTGGRALVRFAHTPEADRAMALVEDRILRNVSVGYLTHLLRELDEPADDGLPILRAEDWEPAEISLVPVPADAGAQVRSGDATTPCVFVTRSSEAIEMPKMKKQAQTTKNAAKAAVRAEKPAEDEELDGEERADEDLDDADVDEGEERSDDDGDDEEETKAGDGRSAVALERRRVKQIFGWARKLGRIKPEAAPELDRLAQRFVDNGTSAAKASRVFLRKVEAASEIDDALDPAPPDPGRVTARRSDGRIGVVIDARDKFRRQAVSWILERSGYGHVAEAAAKKKGEDFKIDSGEVRGMTAIRLAEECLRRVGIKPPADPLKIAALAFDSRAGGYQTTSDFPEIMDEVVNRTLLGQYELVDSVWRQLVKVGSVSDFKPTKWLRLGTLGRLDKVPEHQEFRNRAIPDAAGEQVQAETYGNIFAVTRQVLVNDDIGAILRYVAGIADTASLTIDLLFWDMLNENGGLGPDMADGYPLFDAAHGNIQTDGTDLGVAGLDANRQLMAAQKDPSGNYYITMRPKVLLVPTALGMTARLLMEEEFDRDVGDGVTKNGVRGLFDTVIDSPYITGTRRYAFADPQRFPTFAVVFLNGQQTPFTESRDGWRIDGTEYKVRIDVGMGAVDYKTAVTDDGTTPS